MKSNNPFLIVMSLIVQTLSSKKVYQYLIILLSIGLLIIVFIKLFPYVPDGKDWVDYFRPAIILMFSGKSPYDIPFNYPPWALLPLAPLAILPAKVGSTILVIASPIVFSLIVYKLGAKPITVLFFVFSSPIIHSAFNINIDWLPALGLLMPPQFGLIFILIKPQSGIGLAVYWLFDAWQKDRFRGVFRVIWPVSLACLISFAIYGFWPLSAVKMTMEYAVHPYANASIFPYGIPIGIIILFYTIRNKLPTLSVSSSPLFSPFVTMQSWSSFLLGLINYPAISISASILSWIITAWGWSLRP
jgi:hypothetical protein